MTSWQGWNDSLSGIWFYHWEIFLLEKIGDELRERGRKYLEPVYKRTIGHSNNIPYTFRYTPDVGVYSIILEVTDHANNSEYVRRFVIYDPSSNITTLEPMKLVNAYDDTFEWQRWNEEGYTDIVFSWENHFINQLHHIGGYLNKINDYPPQLKDEQLEEEGNIFKKDINKYLVDPKSNRTQDEIANKKGIVK